LIRAAIYLTSLISVLAVVLLNTSKSETIHFDVVRSNKTVGEFVVVKTYHDDLITYKSSAIINTRFIKKIPVLYQIEVIMDEKEMKAADAFVEVNGKIRSHTVIKQETNKYHIQRKGKNEKWVDGPINYPAIFLLFNEPVDIERSFSEESGDFHDLYDMGHNTYKKIDVNGRDNWYFYENGKLQRAKIDAGLIKFEIILNEGKTY
jgi:hypothetical protein